MGGICSRASAQGRGLYSVNGNGNWQHLDRSQHRPPDSQLKTEMTPPQVREVMGKQSPEEVGYGGGEVSQEEFYDGIPLFTHKSRSARSTHAAVAKVSEVGSRIGRAGTLGIGKAVEVLDTLGSSMTNLNTNSGFVSGVATKGNDIAILAFEVANTVVKGSSLMQSFSQQNVRHLKEVVLPSEGVQHIVSKDTDELLRTFAADKREELEVFSGEVVRFGNRCKDPQWHNLDRYFEKISRELTPQTQLKDEAESVMSQLMTMVHHTADLYHEFHALDRFEQDYHRKRSEEDGSASAQKGDSVAILRAELKSQRKQVKILKKKSLWSRSLEEVMEKLVDIVHFLYLEIYTEFGTADNNRSSKGTVNNHQKLGPAGLSLHYANIILQIDTLVARSSSIPPNTRDTLYQNLPPSTKIALRSKLQSFHVDEEFTVTDIKNEMEQTLQWLVPMASNTAKAHHGFGWVGEWANTGSDNPKPTQMDVVRIETLYHADKEKTESYILELVTWLHHLVSKSKAASNGGVVKSTFKSTDHTPVPNPDEQLKPEPASTSSPILTIEDQKMLQDTTQNKRTRGISKSQDFDSRKMRLRKYDRLSKSSTQSPIRGSKESFSYKRLSSVPIIDFGIDKEKALNVIDRVDMVR